TVGTINFNTGSGNNSSFHSLIQFGGGTNILNVGTINVCQTKAQFATVQFLSGTPASAGVRIRGTAGNSDDTSRATIVLGDRANTGSGNTDGEMLLNGHPVDIKASTLTVGQDRGSSSGTHSGIGVLQFDQGTVDAQTISMAVESSSVATATATGTITVGANGTLTVGSGGLSLANRSGGGTASGTLTINGGRLNAAGNVIKSTTTSTTGTINFWNNATLILGAGKSIGTPAARIDTIVLDDGSGSTLHFNLDGTVAIT